MANDKTYTWWDDPKYSIPEVISLKGVPQLITRKEICESLSITRAVLSRMIKARQFPPPEFTFGVNGRTQRWRLDILRMYSSYQIDCRKAIVDKAKLCK